MGCETGLEPASTAITRQLVYQFRHTHHEAPPDTGGRLEISLMLSFGEHAVVGNYCAEQSQWGRCCRVPVSGYLWGILLTSFPGRSTLLRRGSPRLLPPIVLIAKRKDVHTALSLGQILKTLGRRLEAGRHMSKQATLLP